MTEPPEAEDSIHEADEQHENRNRSRWTEDDGVEPRQSALSRSRFYEGAGDRLLHANFAVSSSASQGSTAYVEALSGRRERFFLLRKAMPGAPAAMGENDQGSKPPRGGAYRLLRDERFVRARVGRESR